MLAAIAAASGWTVGRQHNNPLAMAAPSALSDQKWSADPGQLVALAPVESREQAYELEHEAPASPDADNLANVLTVGTDHERHTALTSALQHDIELPPDVLIQAFENDQSDDVRLLAFSTYIDANSDDVELVRAALQRATNNTSSAVQAEAHRRLTELTKYEAALAALPGQGMP